MRKVNIILGTALILLMLVHLVVGILEVAEILEFRTSFSLVMSYSLVAVMSVHIVIGVILSLRTARSIRISGTSYTKENMLFWIRRLSGFLIMVFAVDHVLYSMGVFGYSFAPVHFIANVLLVISLAVHVVSDIRPVMVGFGISRGGKAVIICLLLILAASAAAITALFIGGK